MYSCKHSSLEPERFMARWSLVGNETQEDQTVLVTCVVGMLFAVDHKGEVDAALSSGRIPSSKEMW